MHGNYLLTLNENKSMLAKLYQPRVPQNSMAYNEDAVKLTLPIQRGYIRLEIWETVIELWLDNKSALSGISLFSMIEGRYSYE